MIKQCFHTLAVSVFAGYYGKENFRSGQDMHNYISSGFVTLGRGRLKGEDLNDFWRSCDTEDWSNDAGITFEHISTYKTVFTIFLIK